MTPESDLTLRVQQISAEVWTITYSDKVWHTVATLTLSVAGRVAVIHGLLVDSGDRKRGLARQLLNEAESLANACGAKRIEGVTHEGNHKVARLLESMGAERAVHWEKRL